MIFDNTGKDMELKAIHTIMENLLKPSAEFTPIPFWFYNDAPDKEKIKKQFTDYMEKGVNGIVLHPRIGIPKSLEYLSEEYFRVAQQPDRPACPAAPDCSCGWKP